VKTLHAFEAGRYRERTLRRLIKGGLIFCNILRIVPKYAQINITTQNAAAKKTRAQAQTLRIKNEIKYHYFRPKIREAILSHTRQPLGKRERCNFLKLKF
jgi:hypothetical protein